ncbi:adenylyltransferase/cytidyltransferase family protein [Sulfitobacter sp.]|uniref:adenylyltransferase/cytidyltransferase family protein n=1 Tax=Sulfitobacter sp. TaxID=1903071 RepID=UPI001B60C4DC|nr:adenylyltransferase/cytidyltransferase family protein [Sulfitobacter sp.]
MLEQSVPPFRVRNRAQAAPSLTVNPVERIRSRSVLTYGCFDGFRAHHARLLADLSSLGTELIVGCATDAFCAQLGRDSAISFDQRRAVLESCRYVSRVIALDSWDQRRTDIVNYNISVLALRRGAPAHVDDLHDIVQVVRLPSEISPDRSEHVLKSA